MNPAATTITPASTTGKSFFRIASRIMVPTPGHAKTVSVMTAPPRSPPNWSPSTVTMGRSAFFSAWRAAIALSASPLARAVRT